MGTHDGAHGRSLPPGRPASAEFRRQSRARIVFIAAASITWLFTLICVIGVAADGDPEARLGFVILGVPFLAAALATTYGARTPRAGEPTGAGEITRAAHGRTAPVPAPASGALDLGHLPAGTSATLATMRAGYAELDAKLTAEERDTEAWRTMTQIVHTIVPTTVSTYRRVAGYGDADAEFTSAVELLSRTFDERRTVVETAMLDGLHTEARYIEDRFTPSELTIDDRTGGEHTAAPDQPRG